MANSQSQLHQAHQLLKAKKYQQAYQLLKQMPDDPIAQEWLQKLEAMRKKKQQQSSMTTTSNPPVKNKPATTVKHKAVKANSAKTKTKDKVKIYALPHRHTRVLATAEPQISVTPIGFLEMPERVQGQNVDIRWLNIQFTTKKGDRNFGWVPEGTSPLNFGMNRNNVPESDLPYHDNKDINTLIGKVRGESYLAEWGGSLMLIFGIIIGVGILFGSTSEPTAFANFCGGIVLLYAAYLSFRGLNALFRWITGGDRARGRMMRYLKAIRLSKETGQELSTAITATNKNEHQRNIAGGLAAGAVAVVGTLALAAAAANEAKKAQTSQTVSKRTTTSSTRSSGTSTSGKTSAATTPKPQRKPTPATNTSHQQFKQQQQRQQQQQQYQQQQQQRMEEQRRRDEMANMQAHFNQQHYGHE